MLSPQTGVYCNFRATNALAMGSKSARFAHWLTIHWMAPQLTNCDFPESQIRFATGRTIKGLSILFKMAPLQAPVRRENALTLLDRFNPSLVSFDGTSHLHRSSSVTPQLW